MRPIIQLGQLGLDPGAQRLEQTLQIAELGRPDRAGNLSPERQHQSHPRRIGHIGEPHVKDAGAQQGDARFAGLASAPELQMGNRQALRIVLCGLEPVPVPHDQHIQVTVVHIL